MAGGWDKALDAQTDLVHCFRRREGLEYLERYAQQIHYMTLTDEKIASVVGDHDIERCRAIVGSVAGGIGACEPVWVSDEVIELVEYAADTFKPEAIQETDLFIPHAFCLLERPISILDRHDKTVKFRAVSWNAAQKEDGRRSILISLWSHRDDRDDYHPEEDFGRLAGSDLALMHTGPFAFGDSSHLEDPYHHLLFRHLQVMWRLAQQRIVSRGPERASRPTWRRAATWREIKTVQVLTLRKVRPKKYEGEERDVEWSHRWMVGGHWRDQWYPSLGVHRQIWIAPYVKGPEDKPFVAKRKAVEFVR